MIHERFNIGLSKALYTIAKADGEIQEAEKRKLNVLKSFELYKHLSIQNSPLEQNHRAL